MKTGAKEIADYLGLELIGPDVEVLSARSLDTMEKQSVVFASSCNEEIAEKINRKGPELLAIVLPEYENKIQCSYLRSHDPRMHFVKVLQRFFVVPKEPFIAGTAVLGRNVQLGENIRIGEYTVIGNNVQIGDRTEIRNHVVIADHTMIGSDCVIKSHAVIGEEGFGPVRDEQGHPVLFPHVGNVVIGHHVQIGTFSSVNRAALDSTVIKDYTKIDDHTFIAHNIMVGEDCVITCAKIGGSCKIGKNVWIGSNVTIKNLLKIEDNSLVGIGAVVVKNVGENKIVAGNPAKVLRDRF